MTIHSNFVPCFTCHAVCCEVPVMPTLHCRKITKSKTRTRQHHIQTVLQKIVEVLVTSFCGLLSLVELDESPADWQRRGKPKTVENTHKITTLGWCNLCNSKNSRALSTTKRWLRMSWAKQNQQISPQWPKWFRSHFNSLSFYSMPNANTDVLWALCNCACSILSYLLDLVSICL